MRRSRGKRSVIGTAGACALLVMVLGGIAGPAFAATDRCALLTDAEIAAAIGAHEPGYIGVNNPWGNNSCRWVATAAPAVRAPEGWRDSVEVAVWEGGMLPWAKDQVRGVPIAGVAKNATWDRTSAELWWECAGGRVCALKLRTADSKQRQDVAMRLVRLVDGRLR